MEPPSVAILLLSFTMALAGCAGEEGGTTCVPGGLEVAESEATGVINGTCAPEGERFVDHFSCEAIGGPCPHAGSRGPSARVPADPARQDDADLAWTRAQLESCSCVCCHNNQGVSAYIWSYDFEPAWTDSIETERLSRMSQYSDANDNIEPTLNNGFSRTIIGTPTTDGERFRQFLLRELERRSAVP